MKSCITKPLGALEQAYGADLKISSLSCRAFM